MSNDLGSSLLYENSRSIPFEEFIILTLIPKPILDSMMLSFVG